MRFLIAALALCIHAEDLKDVEYGRAGNHSLRLDLHVPEGAGPFPALILVHGGAWVMGDRINSVQPLLAPLSDAGFAWFTISYRLAGDVIRNPIAAARQLGTAENDIRRAIAFVKDHAAEYRVDPDKIALIGLSAGGQLASMAALHSGGVKGVIAFYAPTDLASLARTSSLIPEKMQGTVFDDLLMAGLKEFSPINHVTANAPPFLLIHGSDDNIVPFAQSERFRDKLIAAGVPCELYRVEGAGHGISTWPAGYQGVMFRWLRQVFTASTVR